MFVESFDRTTHKDAVAITANWDTVNGVVILREN